MKNFKMTFKLNDTTMAVIAPSIPAAWEKVKAMAFESRVNCMPDQIKLVSITNAITV